jgi:hypothetical protein
MDAIEDTPQMLCHIVQIEQALREIDGEYFGIRTTYKDSLIRERIFCYEFYHQLRLIYKENKEFIIHGEIDKSGHRDFCKKDRRNPDFVFHLPGSREGNTIVMEVKGHLNESGIKKDFYTLLTYTSEYRYKLGLFVLFGKSFEMLHQRIENFLQELKEHPGADKVVILVIKEPRREIEKVCLTQVSNNID